MSYWTVSTLVCSATSTVLSSLDETGLAVLWLALGIISFVMGLFETRSKNG